MRILWLVAPLALLCPVARTAPSQDPTKLPPPAKAPPSPFEEGMMVRFHMHENYGLVRGIEKLILKGRLDEAKQFAEAIAQAPDEPGLGTFAVHAANVRSRALDLSTSKKLDQAARREAALAAACAGCHTNASVVPDLGAAPAEPPDGATLTSRMARHAWAADRLWDGIMADDDRAWNAGLDVLASSSPAWSQLTREQQGIARRLQLAAETERHVKFPQLTTRTTAYGEILVLCTSCHATAR